MDRYQAARGAPPRQTVTVATQVSITPTAPADLVHEDLIRHCEHQAQRITFLEGKMKDKDEYVAC